MKNLSTTTLAAIAMIAATPVLAQVAPGYTYVEHAPSTMSSNNDLVLGVAAYKICQVKTFLFAAVYVLSAIAFVIFAIRALFTKFEMKHFVPILGAIFVVATADLLVAFMAPNAFYCPTVFSSFQG
jgi:hypothetical protein